MPKRDFVLSEGDYRTTKNEIFRLQREVVNLKNRLATFGVRRHQDTYMPAAEKFYRAQFSNSGSFTVSSESETTFTPLDQRSELSSEGLTDVFTVASDIVTATVDGVFNVYLGATLSCPFDRNDTTDLQLRLQDRSSAIGSWGSSGVTLRATTYHPDVAIGAGGTVANVTNLFGGRIGMNVQVGNQFQLVTTATTFSTLPSSPSVTAVRLYFERVYAPGIIV